MLRATARKRPAGERLRRTSRGTPIEVQVYLRAAPPVDATRQSGERPTREALAAARATVLERSFRTVERFAAGHGLAIVAREPARRMIRLAGTAKALEEAFGTRLFDYADGDIRYRARTGPLFASKAMARIVDSVLGFTTAPIAKPLLAPLPAPEAGGGHPPSAFATLYGLPPAPGRGAGQRIALLQFGGEYLASDTVEAFAAMKIAPPAVIPISVGGAVPVPGGQFDREIALDIQVAGAMAPGATLLLYFGPPGNAGFVDTLAHAVHDTINRPTIISISFGDVEEAWEADVLRTLTRVLSDAALLGITVIAAAGDMLATSGYGDGAAHVCYPASDPQVLACGGTTLRALPGRSADETVWNAAGWGTGGGISAVWPLPSYQAGVNVPRHATSGKKGRGLPDVSAIGDRAVGYRIRCHGAWTVEGGTSAAAPLWAGLIASANAARGHDLGLVHPMLYAAPQAFNDVRDGDNLESGIGYRAAAGWDPCTGLGSPRADLLLDLLRRQPGS